jgi:hypothetical protein
MRDYFVAASPDENPNRGRAQDGTSVQSIIPS